MYTFLSSKVDSELYSACKIATVLDTKLSDGQPTQIKRQIYGNITQNVARRGIGNYTILFTPNSQGPAALTITARALHSGYPFERKYL